MVRYEGPRWKNDLLLVFVWKQENQDPLTHDLQI